MRNQGFPTICEDLFRNAFPPCHTQLNNLELVEGTEFAFFNKRLEAHFTIVVKAIVDRRGHILLIQIENQYSIFEEYDFSPIALP